MTVRAGVRVSCTVFSPLVKLTPAKVWPAAPPAPVLSRMNVPPGALVPLKDREDAVLTLLVLTNLSVPPPTVAVLAEGE